MELADLDPTQSHTFADYLTWDFKERVELIGGRLFPMSTVTYNIHQAYSIHISATLWLFLRGKTSIVLYAPFDVRFPNGSVSDEDIYTVLQPDIIVICNKSKLDDKGCLGAPDIVVEILSPGNNVTELKNKFNIYEESGVKEYWIVSPQDNTFLVNTLADGRYITSRHLVAGDFVTTPILPGFSLDLEELFSLNN